MDIVRSAFALLGRRLPMTSGILKVPGIEMPVTVRRDIWGIPHIDASVEVDAWYGLGFCHGQDRSFQLETLKRVINGTLSALVGQEGLSIDRLSRRIGFARGTSKQLRGFAPDIQSHIEAYVRGVNAGSTLGLPKKAHEFVLLGSRFTPWAPEDVVGMIRLQSFLFATNADAELARLKILLTDGPAALGALDPTSGESWQGILRAHAVAPAVDSLSEDLSAFADFMGAGGASNSWVLSGRRTAGGRPLLANDPHLPALLPSPWYLAHLSTPQWAVAGATLIGGPAVEVGHNGFAAWGITAALLDNTDLFQEQLGPDGKTLRQDDEFLACEVLEERIKVRFGRSVTEQVVITPRGPVISPALDMNVGALSISAFWLRDGPVEGFLRIHRTRSFDEFRHCFAKWPGPDLNLSYADESGTIGWQLVGSIPVRKKGWGTIPLPGWDPAAGWEQDPVPFDQMPYFCDPERGFFATANTRPYPEVSEPFLGVDWIDGYRLARIMEVLPTRDDWDLKDTQNLQLDVLSIPWRDMREVVLRVAGDDPETNLALQLLREWDGRITADSPAVSIFEFFLAEMARAIARAKAPYSADWALGLGMHQLLPYTSFSYRRVGHLVQLLRDAPPDWFEGSWSDQIGATLKAVVRKLKSSWGDEPEGWAWGKVRPVWLKHPIGERKPMDRIFNLGPTAWGGDSNTISQTSVDPLNETGDPAFIASLRMVADVGNWDACRWILPAGQSGNPRSKHYGDQLPLWRSGDGVAIAWSPEAVKEATVATLTLSPR